MKLLAMAFGLATITFPVHAQTMDSAMQDGSPRADAQAAQTDDNAAATAAQEKASRTFAASVHKTAPAAKKPVNSQRLTPLTAQERAVQMLDRFTFGARPGDVEKVMALGPDKWLEQQLNPDAINDGRLNKRLLEYPTLAMTAEQATSVFPSRVLMYQVADGKAPYPADPVLHAVYEVKMYKLQQEQALAKAQGQNPPAPAPTKEEIEAQRAKERATAARVAGALFALPKQQRMAALIAMPVEDRVAFTGRGNLQGEQQTALLADFTPAEREAFESMAGNVDTSGDTAKELVQARVLSDILSERQLQQVMTDFWFNHFNVFISQGSPKWYTTSYVRDTIRPNALGTFKDLLLATAQSPDMMVYLNNDNSIGPDSLANGVNPANPKAKRGNHGLNENYGREVMELHTVGVGGGYTQTDVTTLSAMLTGWGAEHEDRGGGFVFDPRRHEPGPKYWFGYEIGDDGTVRKLAPGEMPKVTFGPGSPGFEGTVANADSVKQGLAALTILANSPQTAHFISSLLAQYFVADEPPASLVDRLTKVYLSSGGDIKTMLRAIAASPEFNSKQYFRNKVKTPEEFVASAFRATATDPVNVNSLAERIGQMGMKLYDALPPTGYYLTAAQWMSSSALVDRLNFSYNLTTNRMGGGQMFDAPKLLALGLMSPAGTAPMTAVGGVKPVVRTGAAAGAAAKTIAFAPAGVASNAASAAAAAASRPGAEVTLRVLESTVVGTPVSAQTNVLIHKQLDQQPASANPVDTLNLLTALVLGSPEFQLR